MRKESRSIIDRYERRTREYSALDPAVYLSRQELERALIIWLGKSELGPISELKAMEVGCGNGSNLAQFIRLGFAPQNIMGSELQRSRVEAARQILPAATRIEEGDALDLTLPLESFDIVYQSLVFSSILDDATQIELAEKMWSLAKPGGGVLWYDFTYDNPANPDVRGVTKSRVRELFPGTNPELHRISLAPPISRAVTKIHPLMYPWFNFFPFLRTHLFSWIKKD